MGAVRPTAHSELLREEEEEPAVKRNPRGREKERQTQN